MRSSALALVVVLLAALPAGAQSSLDSSAFGMGSSMARYSAFSSPGVGLGGGMGFGSSVGGRLGSTSSSSFGSMGIGAGSYAFSNVHMTQARRGHFGNLGRLEQMENYTSPSAFNPMQSAGMLGTKYTQPDQFDSQDFYAKRTADLEHATTRSTYFGPNVKFSDMNKLHDFAPRPLGVYPPANAFNPMQSYTARQSIGQ